MVGRKKLPRSLFVSAPPSAGVMARALPDLVLTFDAQAVLWNSYDRIDIDFSSAPDKAIIPEGKNTFTLRLGADYATHMPGLSLRAGVIYDHAAIPSTGLGPGLPDSTRIDGALGVGYGRGHFKADLGYLLVYFLAADASSRREGPEGTYHTVAHLFGLTLRATWP